MKRLLLFSLCIGAQINGAIQAPTEPFVKVFIHKIHNDLAQTCKLEGLGTVAHNEVVKPAHPLRIPFISIGTYLKQFAAGKAYTPEDALKIDTPYGRYCLWASESGVMYAQDPDDMNVSIDSWEAEKIVGVTREEHNNKNLYLATLVLKAIKNKLKIALEPVR